MGKALPFSPWPPADRSAWQNAVTDGDLFDGRGPAAHWSEASRRSTQYGYGRWLGWLGQSEPDALSLPPSDRVTPERVALFVAHLDVSMGTSGTWNYVKNLYDAVRVMVPDGDCSWLHRIVRRLARKVTPESKTGRVVFSDRLLDLGLSFMDDARAGPPGMDRVQALLYRDGLIIALLSLIPLRRRNIAMIRVGTQLIDIGGLRQLVFEADETKNRQPLEFDVPDVLIPHLDIYLREIRPLIGNADDHGFLWPSMKGGGLTGDRLYNIVRNRTRAGLGVDLSIHLFRDCAATTLAAKSPKHAQVARDLLGHADFRTTETHYIRAMTMEVGRRHQSVVERDRATVLALRTKGND